MIIKGKLIALGNENDSVIFTALDTNLRWKTIWIKNEASPCSLNYCQISFANNSAIYNEANLYLSNSLLNKNFTDFFGGGIFNRGILAMANNIIIKNFAAGGGGIANIGRAIINNNGLLENFASLGGGIANFGIIIIANNQIVNNFAYNGGGIYNRGEAILNNNTVIDSSLSTIFILNPTITINNNNLNNLNFDGYTIYNNSSETINARNNYWYTLDSITIEQKLYDFYDDFTKGIVYYQPFLREPIGIKEIKEKKMNKLKEIYDIQGRIIRKMKKGIYFLKDKNRLKKFIFLK